MMERKTVPIIRHEFKASADDGPGTLSGYGSTWSLDEGGDVILRGAFKDALSDFLYRGFVPLGHNWAGLPIASISDVKEDDDGLWFEAEFHSIPAAQDARTVTKERLDRGKFVGLSIGFMPDYDDGGVEFRDDGVRVIKRIKELAEISIVTVPMNREAGVSLVKGLGTGLSFEEHGSQATAVILDFLQRAQQRADGRFKAGRVLSAANRTLLSDIRVQLGEAGNSLDSILEATDPAADEGKGVAGVDVHAALLRLRDVDFLLAENG